jgi:hypothetical protein
METFNGMVRKISENGKRVLVARNHGVWEIDNTIPDLRIGEKVVCNQMQTIQRLSSPADSPRKGKQNYQVQTSFL